MAQVVIDLCVMQPKLLPLLLTLIMEKCPYTIPKYIEHVPGQTEKEYKACLGYIVDSSSNIEGEQSYFERMTGIISLYGAIVQTLPTIGAKNPYGIENSWIWLSTILNIKPQDITPYLICSFLDVSWDFITRTSNFL